MFRNKNVYILNFRKNSSTNQTKRNQRDARTVEGDAWTAEGDAWSLYGMRCADLYGLVAFAQCAAQFLYGMRCADRCGLVAFARCAAHVFVHSPLVPVVGTFCSAQIHTIPADSRFFILAPSGPCECELRCAESPLPDSQPNIPAPDHAPPSQQVSPPRLPTSSPSVVSQ